MVSPGRREPAAGSFVAVAAGRFAVVAAGKLAAVGMQTVVSAGRRAVAGKNFAVEEISAVPGTSAAVPVVFSAPQAVVVSLSLPHVVLESVSVSLAPVSVSLPRQLSPAQVL